MKRLSQAELEATHRIYNHVDQVVNYYGPKTLDEASEFVSENRWIMFPVLGVESLREGTGLPLPNVFLAMEGEEISDNGSGQSSGYAGLTYNNTSSMAHLFDIFRRPRTKGSVLLRALQSLSDAWSVDVVHKIKTDSHKSTPQYEVFRSEAPSEVSLESLQNNIADSDRSLPQPGDTWKNGNPILSAVTILSIEKEVVPDCFDKDMREIFNIFLRLHALR